MATALDLSTLISLIWGIVSVVIFKVIPLKGGWITLVSYLAPLAVCGAAVFVVDGSSGFTWQKYLVDVVTAYGANQALFNAAKATVPAAVK
jgi:acyl-coenzyme A synthetase/AMP-(fatty) acid ligase